MSQNDLTIANQGFASFRSDLNSALQALGSTNSGTSAPSTTFANQLFYDTTNNILKIRNEDNDAFISLFTLDQTNDNIEALTVNGVITADSLDISGNIDVDGTTNLDAVDIDGAVDINGQTNIHSNVVLDDNNKIILGNGSDLQLYHDGSHSYVQDNGTGNIRIKGANIEMVDNDDGGSLLQAVQGGAVQLFHNNSARFETSANGINIFGDDLRISNDDGQAIIRSDDTSGSSATDYGDITFKGFRATSDETTPLFLDGATGFVGIGTTSPASFGTNTSDLVVGTTSGEHGMTIASGTANSGRIQFADNTSSPFVGAIEYAHGSTNAMIFYTDGSSRLRITSDGKIGVNTSSPEESIHSASSGSNALRISGDANNNKKIEIGYDTTNGAFIKSGSSGVTKLQFRIDNGTLVGEFRSNGDFYTNDGTVHSLSDSRIKKDIADLTDGLDIVKQLKPRTFKYNGKATTLDDDRTRYGFVADEVMAVASQYVSQETQTIDGVEVDDFKSLSTTKMIPMLVKAIQELEARITALEG